MPPTKYLEDLDNVRTALSQSSAFRTWCGAATPAAALTYIGTWQGDPDLNKVAVLSYDSWRSDCVTLDQEYTTQAAVGITFFETVTKTATDTSVFDSFMTSMENILAEVQAQTFWRVVSVETDPDTPERASDTSAVDFVMFRVSLTGEAHS